MEIDFEALVAVYLAESEEGLAEMEAALLALEARPGDDELLHTVFRVAHTLKGNAANLGFPAVAAFAHDVEDALDRLREGTVTLSPGLAGALLEAVDTLRALVPAAAASPGTELDERERAVLARIRAGAAVSDVLVAPSEVAAEAGTAVGGEDSSPSPATSRDATDEASARKGDASGESHGSTEVGGSSTSSSTEDRRAAERRRTLRVDVGKLDRALDLVGEIAIARGRMGQLLADGAAERVAEAHEDAARLHLELQEMVMRMRMVPLGPVFRAHARTVRDLAVRCGKQVRLALEGEDVEVDTSVVEHLRDPLTHMIRNAVDHGVETPAARVARGKRPVGTITLAARHDGSSLVVTMRDDGAGMDRERIAARARERGLAADPARMPDDELFRLVFEPGFSTAAEVTDLSGRGVGLDVVRRGMEALRGSVAIESAAGRGTAITLRLPLSLALIDGFLVGSAGDTFVLPLESVVECVELPRQRHDEGAEGVLSLRGKPLPYLRLRDFLGLAGEPPRRESVVVIRHDAGHAGVVVDDLLGASQAVVKPLGRAFDAVDGFSGSTILGSGRVGLILDVPVLMRRAMERAAVA